MKKYFFSAFCFSVIVLFTGFGKSHIVHQAALYRTSDSGIVDQFENPIWSSGGADPWIWQQDGIYYFTYTQGAKVVLYKTGDIAHLGDVVSSAPAYATVYTPPSTMKDIWAPELHRINNKWYMYFAADDGTNSNHRMYVIENDSIDPTTHNWVLKGKVSDSTDNWAIDGTILDYNDQLYMIWSGWESPSSSVQNLYIAKLSDPWTIEGSRVKISSPQYDWEKHGLSVNEGPAVLKNAAGNVFVTYSGSLYATDNYCLGMLSLKPGGDPMNAADWTKSTEPVFARNDTGAVYGPGHNGFFKSPDGTEDWIVYHARSKPNAGDNNPRNVRIQRFNWNSDGTPDFGIAASVNQSLDPPGNSLNTRSGAFVTVWKTDYPGGSNDQIQFNATGSNFNIHWENKTNAADSGNLSGVSGANTVTFPDAGTYVVSITQGSGTFTAFAIGGNTPQKLLSVVEWGNISWTSFVNAFNGAINMGLNAVDTPVLANVTSMASAFKNCSSLTTNPAMDNWHTGNVTDMSFMFNGASAFNQDISNWNTSGVINMSNMFNGATVFNQPVGNWNTSHVTNIGHLVQSAKAFDQDLGNLDVENVSNMAYMFYDAESFNRDLHNWNTSKVENMVSMFQKAAAFNQDIGSWNLQSVKIPANNDGSLVNMLANSGMDCSSYSQTLTGWATSSKTPSGLRLDATGLSYDSAYALAARQTLINTKGWTINGDQLGHCSVSLLPITLLSFAGSLQKGVATLEWQTGVEGNFNHFEIETLRLPGNNVTGSFTNLGIVNANGSSSYTFSVPQQGTSAYYRLKIIDNDGSYTYSDVITLSQDQGGLSVYPNPARDRVNIVVPASSRICIYNVSGRLVITQLLERGLNTVDIRSLSAGIYFCHINGTTIKLLKQ